MFDSRNNKEQFQNGGRLRFEMKGRIRPISIIILVIIVNVNQTATQNYLSKYEINNLVNIFS